MKFLMLEKLQKRKQWNARRASQGRAMREVCKQKITMEEISEIIVRNNYLIKICTRAWLYLYKNKTFAQWKQVFCNLLDQLDICLV